MVTYLIKFILCSGFLYSFYKVFLERESMYKINRFYLLFALLFSLIAPLYKINLPITEEQTNISPELMGYLLANPELLQDDNRLNFNELIQLIYALISVGLLLRFVFNIINIAYQIKQDEKIKMQEITMVLDKKIEQPFSFLHYIFIPKAEYTMVHPNLIQHEKAHCIQKHSWDILFIEAFTIVFWFNPFVYLYKKSIQLNHEFLADEYVLQNDVDVKMYQHQILDCIATQQNHGVASHFNFILTKKRLVMMTKQTSKRKARILSFAAFPFLFSAVVLFSQKSFAQQVENGAKEVEKVLDKKIDNPIKEVLSFQINEKDTIIKQVGTFRIGDDSEGINTTIIKGDKAYQFPKEIKDLNKNNIENIVINHQKGEAIVALKSNETITYKLEPKTIKNNFEIINKQQLNDIPTKDIKAILVEKDRKTMKVIKQNNDTITVFVDAKFKENASNILKVDDLPTNELITEKIKTKLKELKVKDIPIDPDTFNFEMLKQDGKKIFKFKDQVYLFGENDDYLGFQNLNFSNKKPLSKEQIKAIENAQNKIAEAKIQVKDFSNKNGWSITTQVVSTDDVLKSLNKKDTDVWNINVSRTNKKPQTKEEIAERIELEKLNEKLSRKRIKELKKLEKQLN